MRVNKAWKTSVIACAVLIAAGTAMSGAAQDDDYAFKRRVMVETQIRVRGVTDRKVLAAMESVKRHLFVPKELTFMAYQDTPLPIGESQTISQPYVVAFMTQELKLKPTDRVLEIGTGSGYQTAVLAEIVKEVYTVEIIKPLAESATKRLKELGYDNVIVKWDNGYNGWSEEAPFDAIIITAAPERVPEKLVGQLKMGGKMIVPVGDLRQELYLITRTESGYDKKPVLPVRFVPMVDAPEGVQ
ncbi:protein-L-isoaspartate(D-aspartate) O-methyltransferase [Candidatus Omnitrophota bacterium]